MRITNNITALNTYRQYNINTTATNKSMEKLSSGSRINRASDDAAGLSISEKMRAQIRGLTQGTRNAEDGVSFIQTAEGALSEVSDMLTRMKELSVQVENGSYSTEDQQNIGAEIKGLGKAIADIYTNTKFNGTAVFGAQTANTSGAMTGVTAGAATAAATFVYGENGTSWVTIKQATTEQLALLTAQTSVADGEISGVSNAISVTADLVENAISEVNTTRAGYGALQNQLDHAANNMATTKENLQAAESRVRDVDMAEEMMNYTKNNILLQASQAMLAQANQQPQGVLQLLQG
jgi:flagellin